MNHPRLIVEIERGTIHNMAVGQVAVVLGLAALLLMTATTPADGFVSGKTWRDIRRVNRDGGPFVGLVVPNAYEMDPVLKSPSFRPSQTVPYIDVQGRSTTYVISINFHT
jgi:hypothetical protein